MAVSARRFTGILPVQRAGGAGPALQLPGKRPAPRKTTVPKQALSAVVFRYDSSTGVSYDALSYSPSRTICRSSCGVWKGWRVSIQNRPR
jgi:hypothetical protein